MHAVDKEVIEEAEVQALVAQQQQDDGELVLQPQEDTHAYVLQAEEGRQRHPQERCEQAAAKVEQEADKAVHPAGLQVQVEVVVLGAHQLGGARRPAGRVHAGGVGAMEGANPPRDGDHGHGWARRAPGCGVARPSCGSALLAARLSSSSSAIHAGRPRAH